MRNIFSKIVQKMRQEDQLQTSFCFFKKLYMRKKQVTFTLVLIYFGSPRLEYNKNKLYILVLKKILEIDSPPHFVHELSRKMFLMLYSNYWPNFIAWLLLLIEISGSMCIVIIFYLFCDAINFEIYLHFLIKPGSYMIRNSEQKLKYLKNEKAS